MKNNFSKKLLQWHFEENTREMPWKGEKDPYKIWLSEIILQQTKVEQGLKYYENFIKTFPSIMDLAKASDTIVFKMWESLGYYNRCRNLLETARVIAKNGGIFPTTYNDIIELKGVGTYTAAAISSFAYNLPYAVVDGNVYRILSRYFGDTTPIDATEGKKKYAELAQNLLDKTNPALYNQAIMDFGATVCKPKLALCSICCLNKKCIAYLTNTVFELPIKVKKKVIKKRNFLYFIVAQKNQILVSKRTKADVWKNLYEFYLLEQEKEFIITAQNITSYLPEIIKKEHYKIEFISNLFTQKLTHQHIKTHFIKINIDKPIKINNHQWVTKSQFNKLPFSAIVNDFLQNDERHLIFNK
jgi:A/G-specific adenine glycosylase